MNVGGAVPGGNMMSMNMQQMYGQQQTQQQVQPNQQPLLNSMGPTQRMIMQGNRMAVPQAGMMNAGIQQQQSQQPVSNRNKLTVFYSANSKFKCLVV